MQGVVNVKADRGYEQEKKTQILEKPEILWKIKIIFQEEKFCFDPVERKKQEKRTIFQKSKKMSWKKSKIIPSILAYIFLAIFQLKAKNEILTIKTSAFPNFIIQIFT